MAEMNNVTAFDAASSLDDALAQGAINAGDAVVAPARDSGVKYAKRGADIYRQMTTEQKQQLNANSGKVHFLNCVMSHSMPTTRQESTGESTVVEGKKKPVMRSVPTFYVLGFEFRTDIDLDVPEIPFLKPPRDLKQKTAPADLKVRHISAGETFVLTRVETMYMMCMPELLLNGYCDYNGDPLGVQFCAKPLDSASKFVIPTPTLQFTDNSVGSIKEHTTFVDDADGNLLPQYAEKFADLKVVRAAQRTSDGLTASKAKNASLASLEIARILGIGG